MPQSFAPGQGLKGQLHPRPAGAQRSSQHLSASTSHSVRYLPLHALVTIYWPQAGIGCSLGARSTSRLSDALPAAVPRIARFTIQMRLRGNEIFERDYVDGCPSFGMYPTRIPGVLTTNSFSLARPKLPFKHIRTVMKGPLFSLVNLGQTRILRPSPVMKYISVMWP